MALTSSLIVPVFNEAPFLPRFLDSIVKQTLPLDQIILCDNHSIDNSADIIRSYASKLPLTLVFEPNLGIIPAMKAGLKLATGDLILRTDADGFLTPNWHQNIQTHFAKDPDLAACTGPWFALDGHILHRIICNFGGTLGNLFINLRGYPLILGCNTAIRLTALKQIGDYEAAPTHVDDQLLSNRLHAHKLKMRWFGDICVYSSTRRWHGRPLYYLRTLLSLYFPSLYIPKNN